MEEICNACDFATWHGCDECTNWDGNHFCHCEIEQQDAVNCNNDGYCAHKMICGVHVSHDEQKRHDSSQSMQATKCSLKELINALPKGSQVAVLKLVEHAHENMMGAVSLEIEALYRTLKEQIQELL